MCAVEFKPLTMDVMEEYLTLFSGTPSRASDYSFTNLWGWANEYGLEVGRTPNLFWIRQTRPEVRYWAPVGDWNAVADWANCPMMTAGRTFIRVPQQLADLWQAALGDGVQVQEDRDQWDYLYDAEKLATLSGNKYHKKKNHVNQFKKQYDWQYHPMTADCIEAVLQLQQEWCLSRECEESETLLAENEAVIRVLEYWDTIPGLKGGALYVNDVMVAYTVGEALTDDTLVVHFEKARSEYRGVYQAINQIFVEHEGTGYTYVNREQDLGDEGLRKAKLTYHPADWLRKSTVTVL
ncbi:Uncharacterized conserved protein UCP018688 [Oleidesulfovibrio alaskensis G20]|uniref:Uncharacterized conserved protein UCP018688 n=1 Tax=Oleidesulfovibrio alaskensis (strain ATCC BAA-1058 / DSM 17464 / G20) TaxID=207559 RepID=Q30Y00_OLEA2|nr:phosphatidylglycerol lysyltransferase domain-containing protein [Oleidesulfovibrio alaskensis]ABB39446.1 Uncharacterized conserved protein UCP018688 [Oleidesulfovibrio alaskensis G20]MBG0772478.1 DUF2156 domain-containing protein [Oleidesulfovibrio alaskensis]MBL3582160.1 DUF2156 domain-containing protein [Oleidesulfovibrio alaskensis]